MHQPTKKDFVWNFVLFCIILFVMWLIAMGSKARSVEHFKDVGTKLPDGGNAPLTVCVERLGYNDCEPTRWQ